MRSWLGWIAAAGILVIALGAYELGGTSIGKTWTTLAGQTRGSQASPYSGSRTRDGKPDLNGIWQVLNEAYWDVEAHSAEEGAPGGIGVVEGGGIPYKPEALAKRKQNWEKRATEDPSTKCFLAGVPRITYVPLPFEIVQTPKYVVFSYAYEHARRIAYTDGSPHPEALEFWMGDSRGKWEGDTLVIDNVDFNDKTWFDHAGNYHSNALHVIERYTPTDADHITYEATIEDPKVFSRPWKMNMTLYRRRDAGLEVIDYDCVSFFWKKVIAADKAKAN